MYQLTLTFASLVAIAQLSLQISLPNDEHFKYSFENFSPNEAQNLDMVVISDANQSNLNKRTLPVSERYTPRSSLQTWPRYAVGYVNLTSGIYVDSQICFLNPTFCCRFEIYWQNVNNAVNSPHYVYRFGIFQGWNNVTTPPTLCSVFRCTTEDLQDCDRLPSVNTDVMFDNITITANITKGQEYLLKPYSFTDNMLPLDSSNYEWNEFEEKDFYGVQYFLNTTHNNIYVFSINGSTNGSIVGGGGGGSGGVGGGGGGAAALAVSMFIMFCIFLFTYLV